MKILDIIGHQMFRPSPLPFVAKIFFCDRFVLLNNIFAPRNRSNIILDITCIDIYYILYLRTRHIPVLYEYWDIVFTSWSHNFVTRVYGEKVWELRLISLCLHRNRTSKTKRVYILLNTNLVSVFRGLNNNNNKNKSIFVYVYTRIPTVLYILCIKFTSVF